MSLLEGKTTMSVPLTPDAEGYIGRECPKCEKYFKIKPGTGIPDSSDCRCPYCKHLGPGTEFFTREQVNYAASVAKNAFSKEFLGMLKKHECKPSKNAFFSIGISVEGDPSPIVHYQEKDLDGKFKCDTCSLEYAIDGETGYCPDCGTCNTKTRPS